MKGWQKSNEEVESIALHALRNRKDKTVLSNKNVDCYVSGYNRCQQDVKEFLEEYENKSIAQHANEIIDLCDKQIKWVDDCAGYSGRFYTKEESEFLAFLNDMKRKLAFIAKHIEDIKLNAYDYHRKTIVEKTKKDEKV